MSRGKVLFYVQNLLGVGHVVRSARIAEQLVEDGYDVLMVSGGAPVGQLLEGNFKVYQLPALSAADAGFSGLADDRGEPASAEFLDNRRRILIETFRAARPDIAIIETFPFGRRQMAFELLPLIELLHSVPWRPLLLCSIRDVLQSQHDPTKTARTLRVVKEFFDGVLVHGDASWIKLDDTFPLAADFANKTYYTGLVSPPPPPLGLTKVADIVVSAGGGAVGENLITSAVEAAGFLPSNLSWLIVPGPHSRKDLFSDLSKVPENCKISAFRPDFLSILSSAKVSVSQAGYNTVCDVLRARCQAVLVPFSRYGETEQTYRAQRMADLGRASLILEADLNRNSLSEAIMDRLSASSLSDVHIEIDGQIKTSKIVAELHSEYRGCHSV